MSEVVDDIRQWMRQLKLHRRWYDPVFEFMPDFPENQGYVMAGTEFEDLRPRIVLHPRWQDREQEFIDYFKEKREHQ